MTHDERAYLQANIAEVRRMLADIPDEHGLSRVSLEAHLKDLEGQLAALESKRMTNEERERVTLVPPPPVDKRCGTCAHMSETTHKYDRNVPKRTYVICEAIECQVFGEWHDRCSASAVVTPDFSCALWAAREEK